MELITYYYHAMQYDEEFYNNRKFIASVSLSGYMVCLDEFFTKGGLGS